MSDTILRVVLIAVAVAVVAAAAFAGRSLERRRARRMALRLDGLDAAVVFFSDVECRQCEVVRGRLAATGVDFLEVGYREDPDTHRRVGVIAVPLVVVRRPGRAPIQLAGVVSQRRIAKSVRR